MVEVFQSWKGSGHHVNVFFFFRCGFRGGYCEVINLDPEVKTMQLKSISAKLCSAVAGQVRFFKASETEIYTEQK